MVYQYTTVKSLKTCKQDLTVPVTVAVTVLYCNCDCDYVTYL